MLLVAPLLVFLGWLLAMPTHADQSQQELSATVATAVVTDAVLALPIPGTHNSAAFLRLENTGTEPLTLVRVTTNAAAKAQLHSHANVDGMMRMRPVESLVIAPGKTLRFQSGGYHIMLFDVQPTIASGDTVALTLEFESGATKSVQVVVTSRYDGADHSHHH